MNPILQTLLEKVDALFTRVEFLSSKVEAISARVEAISAKVGDLALNFEKLRADFANHLAKSADRDRVLSERISKVETRVADRDKEMIKWFVGIAFALFLANVAAMGLLLEYHNSAPAVYYASPPAVYYAPPAASVLPAPG